MRGPEINSISPERPPRILLVGKDARTDAMAAACQASPSNPELYTLAEMRNPGLVERCQEVFVSKLTDREARVAVVREVKPDLVLIGPEEPLADGFVDDLNEMGVSAFGPTKQLARIESSKSWTRRLLDQHDIPGNPDYRIFHDSKGLGEYIRKLGAFVIKPDGLTAGKGVKVSGDHLGSPEEGLEYAESVLAKDGRVQVEEKLEGEEFSLQTVTDGEAVIHFPLVQDHKRAYEGDQGPNTGGMGSYSDADHSLPFLEHSDVEAAHTITEQVIEALARDTGQAYKGVLYGGFIATASGVRLIEYNARFGDPEAMNVLPIFQGDFVELTMAASQGQLGRVPASFDRKATVCKYVVPQAYPDRGEPMHIEAPIPTDDVRWFWAASEQRKDGVYTTASRSAAAVGIGDTLEQAEQLAEQAASQAKGNLRHRSDIGKRAIIAARISHMQSLRSEFVARSF